MKVRKFKKPCKRNKCPYYKRNTTECYSCEWNPNAVWTYERKVKEK